MSTELTLEQAALAWAHGKRVECLHRNHVHEDDWKAVDGVGECEIGKISQHVFGLPAIYRFRLAPEPPAKKFRPWTPEEVPVGLAVIRKKDTAGHSLILDNGGVDCNGVSYVSNENTIERVHYMTVFHFYEHSLDGGKTWLPCGVGVSE